MSQERPPVAVIGLGTMGAGIAQLAAEAGHEVWLLEQRAELLAAGRARLAGAWARQVEKGRMGAGALSACEARLHDAASVADLAPCGWVIEAIAEDLDVKRRLFAELDAALNPGAILASNTSSLSITALGGATRRADRVVGLHFFNPPALMALVEVIAGRETSPATFDAAAALAASWGKTAVRAPDTPGFIVNRVARPFYGEGLRLASEAVAPPEQVDRLMRDCGFRMGPFELMDLIGIDVNYAVTRSVYQSYFEDPRYRPSPVQRAMVESGRLGRKSGRGFYRHGE
jgi:3-hydroxybutyryl-CoA dehydrogenase